eukprot:scaffold42478_cov128-Skeletonema_dohrnii-CCMP3373.AAC.1
MSCPWSRHSTCEQVGNMVHGVAEEVGGRWARQISDPNFTGRASKQQDPFAPLRAAMQVMKMKPTIRMSRHGPSGPMYARWGGGLTI